MIMRKIKFILIITIFLFIFSTKVQGIVNPTKDFYINDYANILSEKVENYILNKSIDLNKFDGTQIVVVTVKNLEGLNIEDYSLKLFNNFGIGDKYKNNGLLILISLSERQFRIIVGYGLENVLSESKIGQIQDKYMVPYFKKNDWDEGLIKGYDILYDEICQSLDIGFIEKNRNIIDVIFGLINLFVGLIFPFIIKFIKNNNLYKSDKIINFKCILYYIFVVILIVILEIILRVNFFMIFLNVINTVMATFIVIYKINNNLSDGYRLRIDRSGSYGGTSSGGSSGFSGGGGSSGGRGSSRKF